MFGRHGGAFLIPKQNPPMDTKPPSSLPSLKLMQAANKLMHEADSMDSSEIAKLMDSFPMADSEKQWEIVGTMFLRIISHPKIKVEDIYAQFKKMLMDANAKL